MSDKEIMDAGQISLWQAVFNIGKPYYYISLICNDNLSPPMLYTQEGLSIKYLDAWAEFYLKEGPGIKILIYEKYLHIEISRGRVFSLAISCQDPPQVVCISSFISPNY